MDMEHPDWLPVGWKITVKARPTGKKDKYYVNPSTGQKFKSRPDVLKFLKRSREVERANARSRGGANAKSTVANAKITVANAKSTVAKAKSTGAKAKSAVKVNIKMRVALELPPGWIKKVKITKNHGKKRRDPTYIELVSGHHCRSMVEVFRYIESKEIMKKAKSELEVTKLRHHPEASEAKEQRVNDKKSEENIIRYERVRSGRKLAGGLKVAATKNENMPKDATCSEQSREEVCLAVEFSDKLRKVKRHAHKFREIKELPDNIVAKVADKDQTPGAEVVDEDQTPGTKVVDKEQTLGDKDGDKDQTPKSGDVNDKEPCTEGRRQSKRLADMRLKDNVTKKRSLQSGSKGSVENNINNPVIEGSERQNKKESSKKPVIGGFEEQNKKESSKKPVIGGLEGQNKKESMKRPLIGGSERQNKKECSKKSVSGGLEGQNKKESAKKPVIGGSEGQEQDKTESSKKLVTKGSEGQSKSESSKRKWMGNLPRRTSQRLARVEADPSLEVNAGNKAGGNCEEDVSDTKCASKAGPSSEPEINIKKKVSKSNIMKEQPPKCRTDNPSYNPGVNHQKKVATPGEQKSAGSEHKENDTPEKHLDFSLANLLRDPCIEFAIKTLTGVIPLEDASKVSSAPASSLASPNQAPASSSMLPSATVNIWGDPCFEFAVKTLTSEAPMPKPTTQVQITFQQPFVGGPTVPKLTSDNLCTLKQ